MVGLLFETKTNNKYILIAIDHYQKWCEVKAVLENAIAIIAKFLEDEIICWFGVPKFILIHNGREWAGEIEDLCKVYGIQHQFTTLKWPHYNGMEKWMIKTIKDGITMLFGLPKFEGSWDL